MNPEDQACETSPEDYILCLIEDLRKADARLSVSGKTWSMCWGVGDPMNHVIADRLAASLNAGLPTAEDVRGILAKCPICDGVGSHQWNCTLNK